MCLQIGKKGQKWKQKARKIVFKGSAKLKGPKKGSAYDKNGNELPAPINKLRGVEVELKLKYGCKELEIYDNQCTYDPAGAYFGQSSCGMPSDGYCLRCQLT